ncbi:MAG: S-layer homology domain-containing protein, partial [Bacillota bacterium]|nr:S-layer homology domain-containing protein [Bacillota bacterium]
YQRNITRGEFAHVMAALLEQAGISYDKYIKGLGVNPIANFADTKNDFLIEFVHSCGIINGMSDHEFDPSGILTREQAATMLVRTVSYLGSHVTVTAVSPFSDAKTFSDWATESIYKIAGIHDKNNGSAIMGGIAVGVFSPKTGYTVEQALIAAKRLLSAIIV